jgi:membrane protein DedA with SNARE-associated domain
MAVESAAIPFPSEIIMPLAGWLLVKDNGHGFEYLFLAAFYGALGNTIGSLVAYYAGAWGGRPLIVKYGRYVFVSRRELDWADRWFDRYGQAAVFLSRLMPVVRTFISVPAGVTRMNVWRFTVLTFAGSYPWSFALAWGGYALGENWEDITNYLRPVAIPIAVTMALAVVYYLYRRIREFLHEGAAPISGEDEPG